MFQNRHHLQALARCALCLVCLLSFLGLSPVAAAPPEDNGVVVVAPGDTLANIAAHYGVSAGDLMRLNGITSPDLIHVGQRLLLPGSAATLATPSAAPVVPASSSTHVVQRGETLASIASAYGVSVASIMQLNGLTNPNLVRVGQTLTIPGAGLDVAPSAVPTALPTLMPTALPAATAIPAPALDPAVQAAIPTVVAAAPTVAAALPTLVAAIPTVEAAIPTLAAVAPTVAAALAPAANALPAWIGPAPAPTVAPTPAPTLYTVKAGDTLSKIALRFGVTNQALMSANSMTSANLLTTGQILTIPDANAPVQSMAALPTAALLPSVVGVAAPQPAGAPNAAKWIEVNLAKQRLTAWEGDIPVFSVLISSGLPGTPTVTGTFRTYVKLNSTRMTGPGYDLPNVPWTMYFFQGYGIHGAYWHNNFGHPMSHGCVNMRNSEAKWVFDWAPLGTQVFVHY